MKPLYLSFFVLAALFGCNSGSNESTENNSTEDTSQVGEAEKETPAPTTDFNTFLNEFTLYCTSDEYVTSHAVFPFIIAGSTNITVTLDEMTATDKAKSAMNYLNANPHGEAKKYDGNYLNETLKTDFTKKFSELSNMYVVEYPAQPSGYLAYFIEVDKAWKFIGCELIENAD
ncbi:MAG: hypothetical protein GC181_00765 [Bacteroidetes bacterium]|nr:hypothetical protein [Bacteroidota bacterium]